MYIYIFEDGTICQDVLGPTDADNNCIGDGTLTVLEASCSERIMEADGEELSFCVIDSEHCCHVPPTEESQ